jgi:hypothetical protein
MDSKEVRIRAINMKLSLIRQILIHLFVCGFVQNASSKKTKKIILMCMISCASVSSYAQEIWTIGPMFHVSIGGEKRSTAFSIEAAYWNIDHFIYSFDGGIEIERGKLRLYSEAQTGLGVTGLSLGPVVEFNFKESKTRLGLQGSCWINYIFGVDYRVRFIDRQKFHYVGFYAKLPMATSGLEDGSSSTSFSDWDDWD